MECEVCIYIHDDGYIELLLIAPPCLLLLVHANIILELIHIECGAKIMKVKNYCSHFSGK
jgi:hypothetical protein